MTEPQPPARTGKSHVPALLATGLSIAALGAVAWTHVRVADRLAAVEARLEAVDQRLNLIRLEMDVKGKGVGALIEQIEVWAPELASGSTPAPTWQKVEQRLREVLDAAEALGPTAFDAFVGALEGGSDGHGVETRRWLLRAATRADPERGLALLSRVVRGTALDPSSRLRAMAADDLIELDREHAGRILAQILQYESHNGVQRQPPPGLAPEFERVIGTNRFPDFVHLIDKYVGTGHPEREKVLQMLLGRAEHDQITYQKCIEHLGELGVEEAVPRIQQLYDNPPGRFAPLFQMHCASAVAKIQGARACDWLKQKLLETDQQALAGRLQQLIKQHCP